MSIPINTVLYEKAKSIADKTFNKSSAYKSSFLVKTYKDMGGKYKGDKDKSSGLSKWYSEAWEDVNPLKTKFSYPVYRPTKIINETTPLTVQEIDPKNLLKQSIIKQKIKGDRNLEPFKGAGAPLAFGEYKINAYTKKQAKILGVKIKISERKNKKLDVFDNNDNYICSIGDNRYNDYRSYIEEKGLKYANTRRRLYKIRHEKNRHIEGTPSYYADQLLW